MPQSKLSCSVIISYKLWTTPEVKQMAHEWSYDNSCAMSCDLWTNNYTWVHKFDNFTKDLNICHMFSNGGNVILMSLIYIDLKRNIKWKFAC